MTPRKEPALSMLTEEQAAEYICMSAHYLRCDRSRGTIGGRTPGPAFVKLSRNKVRYRVEDLDAWLAARRVDRKQQSPKRPLTRAAQRRRSAEA